MKKLKRLDTILTVAQHNNLVRSDLAFTHLEAKVFTKLLETIPKDARELGEVSIRISDVIGTGGSCSPSAPAAHQASRRSGPRSSSSFPELRSAGTPPAL